MENTNRREMSQSNREMCFRQGKPYVYRPSDEPTVIRTEWPNGTVDEAADAGGLRQRRWPDGTTETTTADAPVVVPMWPKAGGETPRTHA